jgi:hypothetical protein
MLNTANQGDHTLLRYQHDHIDQALFRQPYSKLTTALANMGILFKGIVSRDFVVCFLGSFDRSDISTHQERVLLLLKVHFRIEFFDFVSGRSELTL